MKWTSRPLVLLAAAVFLGSPVSTQIKYEAPPSG
jgi:hypothetical protein